MVKVYLSRKDIPFEEVNVSGNREGVKRLIALGRNTTPVTTIGDDVIVGDTGVTDGAGDGNDTMVGGLGNDQLYGNGGADFIYGLNGDDIIVGGGGDDLLVFSFANDDDLVVGFEGAGIAGGDLIAIDAGLFSSAADVVANILYASGAAYISFGSNGSVTFADVAANSITADDITIFDGLSLV